MSMRKKRMASLPSWRGALGSSSYVFWRSCCGCRTPARDIGQIYDEVIRLLLEKGADVNAKDNRGRAAILETVGRGGRSQV